MSDSNPQGHPELGGALRRGRHRRRNWRAPTDAAWAHSDHLTHDPSRAAMIAATMGLAGQLIGRGRRTPAGRGHRQVGDRFSSSSTRWEQRACSTVLARPSTNLHHNQHYRGQGHASRACAPS